MDNKYLQNEIRTNPTDKDFYEKQYKLAMMLITFALIGKKDVKKTEAPKESEKENIEDIVRDATSSISCIIFPIMNNVSKRGILNKEN